MSILNQEVTSRLRPILDANIDIDWRVFSFVTQSQLQTLKLPEQGDERERLIPLLKAYQRLLLVLPVGEEARALPLLGAGLHSAIQIASIPRPDFLARWTALFPGEEALGEAVHQSAIARRSYLLLHHIHSLQNNEPHYRSARFQ